jgi:hypothetical protein
MEEPLDCTAYENQEVRPTSIHKSKTEHKEAVFDLVRGITGAIDEEAEEPVPAAAD